jgi:uncharacterized SAM-binding protein YcdF (DUF218 family)
MDYRGEEAEGEGGVPQHTDELGLPESIDRKKKKRRPRLSVWKWIFYIFVIIYFITSAYRSPLLVKLGEYLIIEHEPRKADLIVCLGGPGVVNSLGAIDAYKKGLAPYIFRARELEPDGLDYMKGRVETYPTNFDLFAIAARGFEIPEEVILSANERVGSTIEEARLVHRFALERKCTSIILVTSLMHSRRAYLTFKKVFKDDQVTIISLPSHYQLFNPKDWWKKRTYTKELIIEYQKLIYYKLKYLI